MVYESFKAIRINGTPARIYSILKDAESWPKWDVDLIKVSMKPPAAGVAATAADWTGRTGNLTMKNGSSFDFTVKTEPDRYFGYRTRLFGADADWYWDFRKQDADGVELKMGVKIEGFTSSLWSMVIAPLLPASFDACTNNLKTMVESGTLNGEPIQIGV
ncbi:hypothetical protein DFJ73DRAFT_213569 [Zopfochytrium polystomum]|nr:hypothetical protein DFJ73DRAFT_213569 [Zopfochytrium polystomum]